MVVESCFHRFSLRSLMDDGIVEILPTNLWLFSNTNRYAELIDPKL